MYILQIIRLFIGAYDPTNEDISRCLYPNNMSFSGVYDSIIGHIYRCFSSKQLCLLSMYCSYLILFFYRLQ